MLSPEPDIPLGPVLPPPPFLSLIPAATRWARLLVPLEFSIPGPSAEDFEDNLGRCILGDVADPGAACELHPLRVRCLRFASISTPPLNPTIPIPSWLTPYALRAA